MKKYQNKKIKSKKNIENEKYKEEVKKKSEKVIDSLE